MRKPGFEGRRGTVHLLEHRSRVLQGNPRGDPADRTVGVYTPPGYDPSGRPCPLLVYLAGYHATSLAYCGALFLKENIPERADRLIAAGKMRPAVIVFPDTLTWFGGNQYVNSPSAGRYADWLADEIVPFAESRFHAGGSPARRGVLGKSSGGYGALFHVMTRPDVWGAAASHSGDVGWDYAHRHRFPLWLRELARCKGNPEALVADFWKRDKPTMDHMIAMEEVGQAAFYDPDPKDPKRLRLPFTDTATGEVDEAAWKRWLAHDPLNLVARYAGNLRKLKLLYLDCGTRDQCNFLYGTRQLTGKLEKLKIPHVYQEFDDDHTAVDYRLDVSLPLLTKTLARS